MSTGRLSSRDRRALVALALITAPPAAWFLAIGPWIELRSDLDARIVRESALLERERRDLAHAEEYRVAVDHARIDIARIEHQLVTAPSRALAEAAVADHARTLASLSGVQLRSVGTPGGDTITADLGYARLAVAGDAHIDALLLFLRRLENGPGRVATRGLAVQRNGDDGSLAFELAVDAHYVVTTGAQGDESAPIGTDR